MLKKYYVGEFFWAPIPHKQYQHTSGFPDDIQQSNYILFEQSIALLSDDKNSAANRNIASILNN